MDPVTIFGLAANILAFGELTYKIAREAREIHQTADGSPEAVTRLDILAKNLKQCSVPPAGPPEPPELQELRRQCGSTANKLLEKVQKLQADGKRSKWGGLKIAVKAHYLAKEIASECADLDSLTIQLNQCYLSTVKGQQSNLSDAIHNLTQQFAQHSLQDNRQLKAIDCWVRNLPSEISKAVNDSSSWKSISGSNEIRSLYEAWTKARYLCDLLNTLWFESIPIRHDQILEANLETFRWIHEPFLPLTELQEQQYIWASANPFFHWLRSGGGVYWIAGNAGSGKSTLMKYVSDSEKTRSALESWREDATLVVASFYFWKPGTEKQKSLGGLLQSLLYEIIRQYPDMSTILAPSSTNQDPISGTEAFRPALKWPTLRWHYNDIQRALEKIINQNTFKVKICFFIDGIDEFEGRYDLLFPFLKTLAACPTFKLCISSRPQNRLKHFFQNQLALSESEIINLQEYTKDDIRRFVFDYLENYPEFGSVFSSEESRQRFVDLITDKAEGVFLWADLAVRNLTNGLIDGDTRKALLKRLDTLPESADMDLMFQQMLDGVQDKVFKQQTRKILDVSIYAKRRGIDSLPLASLPYAIFDDDGTILDHFKNISVDELPQLLGTAERRVNARCNGLIKVFSVSSGSLIGRHSGFIHRSVAEFLEERDAHLVNEARADRDVAAARLLTHGLLSCMDILWPLPHCHDQIFYFFTYLIEIMKDLVEYDYQATDTLVEALYKLHMRNGEDPISRDAQLISLLSNHEYHDLLPRPETDDVQALLSSYTYEMMQRRSYEDPRKFDREPMKWVSYMIPAFLLMFGPEKVIEKHIREGSSVISPVDHTLSFAVILLTTALRNSVLHLGFQRPILKRGNFLSVPPKSIVCYIKTYGIDETYGHCIQQCLLFNEYPNPECNRNYQPFAEYCQKRGNVDCSCGSHSSCVPLSQALAIITVNSSAWQCRRDKDREESLQNHLEAIKIIDTHYSDEIFRAILIWYFCQKHQPFFRGWSLTGLSTMIAQFLNTAHRPDLPYAAGLRIDIIPQFHLAKEIPIRSTKLLQPEHKPHYIRTIIRTPTTWTIAMSIILGEIQSRLLHPTIEHSEGNSDFDVAIKTSELFLCQVLTKFLRAGADKNATFFLDDVIILHRDQIQTETNSKHEHPRPLLKGVDGVMEYLRTFWGIDKDGCIQDGLMSVKSEIIDATVDSSCRTSGSQSIELKQSSV